MHDPVLMIVLASVGIALAVALRSSGVGNGSSDKQGGSTLPSMRQKDSPERETTDDEPPCEVPACDAEARQTGFAAGPGSGADSLSVPADTGSGGN